MEGKVWAESEFGKGSIFYFEFPKKAVGSLAQGDVDTRSGYQPADAKTLVETATPQPVSDDRQLPIEEEELLARVDNLLYHSEWRQQYLQETLELTHGPEQQQNAVSVYPSPVMLEEDGTWLEALENTVKGKLGDFDFSLEQLAQEMTSNRWTIYRRIKHLTGLTATQYLKEVRLNHARYLLEQKKHDSVKALAFDVGMKDVKYFSQEFKKRFGKLPSDYL